MLKVWLLGSGQARYYDRSLSGFPNQRACLLLSYLLLNRHHPHNRERLAAIFWGDYPTSTSKKYLRNALWRLRHVLQSAGVPADDYLLISDDSVSFIQTSPYWLDIEDFEKAAADTQDVSGPHLTTSQASQLETAADLYVGDLLSSIYDDWCLYDKERLRILYLSMLHKLMDYHSAEGTFERGLHCGIRILNYDNTRERVHRKLMWLHWRSGDRHAALAQYKRCQQILRDELSIRPMPATQQLYEMILHHREQSASWPALESEISFEETDPDETVHSLTETALQKLHRLQAVIEDTSTELRQIEKLISKALFNTKP